MYILKVLEIVIVIITMSQQLRVTITILPLPSTDLAQVYLLFQAPCIHHHGRVPELLPMEIFHPVIVSHHKFTIVILCHKEAHHSTTLSFIFALAPKLKRSLTISTLPHFAAKNMAVH